MATSAAHVDISYIEAVRALPAPIFMVTANGVVLDCNSAGRCILGVDEIGGTEFSAMIENPEEEWKTLLRYAARSRSSIPGSLILRTPRGHQAWRVTVWCARPASDSQPAVVIIRGEPDDRQAKLFLTLNQQLDLLRHQVNARKHMQDELARALQARDDFVATAAHDLRNPLNVFRLTLQLLYRVAEKPGGNILGILDKLRVQLDRINSLVDRLLDVTRIRAGKMPLEFSTFDLGELVEQIVNGFRQVNPYIKFQVRVEHVLGTWDRFRIDEAVSNIVSNAIKYWLGKPITVTVRAADDQVVVS
jgi:signal transduction histidine kinase